MKGTLLAGALVCLFSWVLFVAYLAGGYSTTPYPFHRFLCLEPNAQGDFLAGALAGPAFLLAALSLWMQARELRLNTEELSHLKDELSQQRTQLEQSNMISERMLALEEGRVMSAQERSEVQSKPVLAFNGKVRGIPWEHRPKRRSGSFKFQTSQFEIKQLSGDTVRRIRTSGVADFGELDSQLEHVPFERIPELTRSAHALKFNVGKSRHDLPFANEQPLYLRVFENGRGAHQDILIRIKIERAGGQVDYQLLRWNLGRREADFSNDDNGEAFWKDLE